MPRDQLARLLPRSLSLDTRDGVAWLGITPFRVTGLRLRGTLPVPRLSEFLELNVRTYVTVGDKPGIYFFSLDAESRFAVQAARRLYRLPYYLALMNARSTAGWIEYSSARREGLARPFVFEGRYRPRGEVFNAEPGSLEHFLTERYCLYAVDARGNLRRAEIHHAPWRLQRAEAELESSTMVPAGTTLPDGEPLLHFSACQDVVVWALSPVEQEAPPEAA